jgi:hypothetical protein
MNLVTDLRHSSTPYLRALFWLAARLPLPGWTLLRLKGIHYGRWALITHLPPGGPRSGRRRLRRPFMFFESNYDGTFEGYIDAFSYAFPRGMWLIWGPSVDYPGAVPVKNFKQWIERRELPCDHYYVAYPDATTRAVLSGLAVREKLLAFAKKTADAEPDEFRSAFDTLLADVQRDL